MAQTTKQIVLLEIIAYLALLTAALIYAFCREPNTYFAFLIQTLFQSDLYLYRSSHSSYSPYAWLIFSLPSGLWVMASTILGGLISSEKKTWSFIPIFLVISIEILQFFGITDGVFDWLDIGVSVAGFLVAQRCKTDVLVPKNRWYFAYGICVLAVPLSDVM